MTQNDREETSVSTGMDGGLARHGGLSYLEIPAADVRQSASFYEKVLGWKIMGGKSDVPKFTDPAGLLIGRWVAGRAISREPGLLPYLYVDRIDEAVKRVLGNAGEVVKAPYAEGNLWVAVVRDPAGNAIGLWQEGSR